MEARPPHPLAPPPLSPEPKRKTSALSFALNALGGAAVGGGATWFVLQHLDLDGLGALALFVFFLVSVWLHIVIHEAGHALAGLAGGLKPVAFGVGPLRMERGADAWHFRWGGSVAGISGFALLLPATDAVPRRREQALYLLGGPLANLATAAVALPLALAAPPGLAMIAGFAFAAAGLLIGLINLVPFKTAGWLSDGAGLVLLRRDPAAAMDGFRVQQIVQASMEGRRPRDWPLTLLPERALPAVDTDAPMALADVSLRLSAAIDRGDVEQARRYAGWMAARWPHAEGQERDGTALSMAVHAAVVEDDLELLRAWRALARGGLLDQTCHEAWLDAEIARREGRIDDARQLAAKARGALPRVHDGGTRTAVAERLDALDARLTASM